MPNTPPNETQIDPRIDPNTPQNRCQNRHKISPKSSQIGPKTRSGVGGRFCTLLGARLGPSWVVLGALGASLGGLLGPSWGVLGPYGSHRDASWSHLGTILGPSWASLGCLGACWCHLGPSRSRLGAVLGPSWGHLGPCWAVLEAWTSEIAEIPKNLEKPKANQ